MSCGLAPAASRRVFGARLKYGHTDKERIQTR
jgi:hypothetical protein